MLQHGAYRLLLDHCWDQKGPLPLDITRCYRICGASSKEEQDAVRSVIDEFFVRMEDGHYNRRMQREIERSESISSARSEAGKRGYEARAKQLPSKRQAIAKQLHLSPSPSPSLTPDSPPSQFGEPPEPPAPTARSGRPARTRADKPVTGELWAAYSTAYRERYSVDPVRNAKVNGQLAKLIERLGADEAPGVARFYLTSRNAIYVASKHCTDLLLRDAEKLRTEWATGTAGTMTQARHADMTQTTVNVFGPMLAEARAREADNGKR